MRSNYPLTNEQIQKAAPAAFAGQPYEKQSDRYAMLPTVDVIDSMRNAGFLPVMADQSRTRIEGKRAFTKHIIRFRHETANSLVVGDSSLETVLINSHDGSSSYTLSMGVFRSVCMNGMVVAESLAGTVRVRHVGNIVEQVTESSLALLREGPKVIEAIKLWRSIELSQAEAEAFADSAKSLRFDEDSTLSQSIDSRRLLTPRRYNDNGMDLYSVFNRVQESLIRGKVRGFDAQAGKRITTRAVKGIDQDVKLNKALWTLGQSMADLKAKA